MKYDEESKELLKLQEQLRDEDWTLPPLPPVRKSPKVVRSTLSVIGGAIVIALVGTLVWNFLPSERAILEHSSSTASSRMSLTVLPSVRLDETSGFVDSRPERIRGLKVGQIVAYLTIPKLGIYHYPIRFGIELSVLAQGPGLYPGSAAPGQGNFAMAGHRITPVGPWRTCSTGQWGTPDCHGPFRYVDTLKSGDIAKVLYQGKVYRYSFVRDIIVNPDDVSVLRDGRADLTMTACKPPGLATSRIVAQWKLI